MHQTWQSRSALTKRDSTLKPQAVVGLMYMLASIADAFHDTCICKNYLFHFTGPSTSEELAQEAFEARNKAIEYALDQRNEAGGWDPDFFVSTGRAILNLQIGTGGNWYDSEEPMDQLRNYPRWYGQPASRFCNEAREKTSVRQLEVEVLTFVTRYLRGYVK